MNDLEELKNLLFGAEKQTLDLLSERVERPETRAADIADVLPEAVRLSHLGGEGLVAELRKPVSHCLKAEFQEAPQEYADALYPVIGPAIRKSIMHALKAFAQQINQTMEHSLSAKGLRWRFLAWRSGVPFGDFVLQQTLQYRVEQAYLISRDNGLLIAHVHHGAASIKDSNAVSAMFTAIQDFVKESFSPDRSGRLETADMGEFTLWAVHGPHALLVCVIRGVPPGALRADLAAILERIHFRYGDPIRSYAGDASSVRDIEGELDECLSYQAHQPVDENKAKVSLPLLTVLLGIVFSFAYFAYDRWQHRQEYARLVATTSTMPGIYVADITSTEDVFTLHGLRDPLAADVAEIAALSGLEPQTVLSALRPYQSLDAEILFRRAKLILDPPDGVFLKESSGNVVVSGRAAQDWIDSLRIKIDADTVGIPVMIGDLESNDRIVLRNAVSALTGAQFRFIEATSFITEDETRLQTFTTEVRKIADEASRLGDVLRVVVTGSTDNTGNLEANIRLAQRRAEIAADRLVKAGVDRSIVVINDSSASTSAVASYPDMRRVTIDILFPSE